MFALIGNLMKEITNIFYCLSDKNRIRILMMLNRRTLCVCEITDILELSASTVSNHLSILKSAGFILDSKDGKWVNYSLNTETKDPKIQQILLMLPMWLNSEEVIKSDIDKITETDRKILCSN